MKQCGLTHFLLCDWSGGQRYRLHVERLLRGLQGVLVEGLLQARNGHGQT